MSHYPPTDGKGGWSGGPLPTEDYAGFAWTMVGIGAVVVALFVWFVSSL